jgi:hypothetical protein
VANLFCSPWEDGWQCWRLVWAGRFGPSSASMSMGSGAAPAKLKAPAWASVFGEAPGQLTCLWRAGSDVAMARGDA